MDTINWNNLLTFENISLAVSVLILILARFVFPKNSKMYKIFFNSNNKIDVNKELVDMGEGLSWFEEAANSGSKSLSQYFNLNKENSIKLKATVDHIGYYQSQSLGKRYVVVAKYFDEQKQKEYIFYCPGWEYNPSSEYGTGSKVSVLVDQLDYSKHDILIY